MIPLLQDFERSRNRIETSLGGIVNGRFIFCGYDVTREIAGLMTQTEALGLWLLERKPNGTETRLLDALITLNIYPDIRIWCIRAGAYAAQAGAPISSAYAASHAALNATLFGVRATLAFRRFITDFAEKAGKKGVEAVIDGMVAAKAFFPGFGRPIIQGPDERVERMKALLKEWNYPLGRFTRLFLDLSRHVTEKTGLHPNYAAIIVTLLLDEPFRLDDHKMTGALHFLVNICSIAPVCESAAREAGTPLLSPRIEDVDYRGVPDRKLP